MTTPAITRAEAHVTALRAKLAAIDAEPYGPGSEAAWAVIEEISYWQTEIQYAATHHGESLLNALLDQCREFD